jgi:signal transduction histidine kinase
MQARSTTAKPARNRESIRRSDAVVTVVLAGLGAYLMWENVTTHDANIRIDSHSWWMVPVFLAAVLPVLWWRRNPLVVMAIVVVVMAVHVVLFGWVARCGAGLPLSWVLAYLVGTRDGVRRSLVGLALVEMLGALVLIHDSAAGPSLLPVVALISVGVWGIGRVARQRSAMAVELEERNEELGRLRDARAALEVTGDRARLSTELDALLDARLAQLSLDADESRGADPETTRRQLATIEADSRRILGEMREIVGVLRGGEVALAPAPSVAHLDALLARRSQADARLVVSGDPRGLPASVELSAYRVVEHLLGVLTDEPDARIDVAMRFEDDALEITVAGPVGRGADVRGAVARARERVRLQHGTLSVKVIRGRARAVALMPVVAG